MQSNPPGPALTIRKMLAEDLDRLFDHRSRPAGEYWLQQQMRGEVYAAVAEWDGMPVGRVCLNVAQFAAAKEAYLWSAHVEPEFQSRGVGSAIFHHLEQVAREHDLRSIRLEVNKTNLRARSLYERLGYRVIGPSIGRWSYVEDGRMVEVVEDNWAMRKVLTES